MNKIFIKYFLWIEAAIITFFLSACAGSDSASTSNSQSSGPIQPPPEQIKYTTVSGVVFGSSSYTYGRVEIYDYTAGRKGKYLLGTSTDGAGAYHLQIGNIPSSILIEANNGCFIDKGVFWNSSVYDKPYATNSIAYCENLSSSFVLQASVTVPSTATAINVSVTPLTHAAIGFAQYEIAKGGSVNSSIDDANSKLSNLLGFDIIQTYPAEPNRNTTFSNAAFYGTLLGGIPTWILNNPMGGVNTGVLGTGDYSVIHFANLMQSDLLADGVLNGIGLNSTGGSVNLSINGVALSTTVYRNQLALAATIRFRAETEGASNPTATAGEQTRITTFLPSLNTYNNSTNTIFDTSPIVSLDNGDPIVIISVPTVGSTLTANNGIIGYIHDDVGILQANAELLIDGVTYTTFLNQYQPNHFINTTVFPNGPHTLTLQATNNLGHTTAVSVNVTFSN